MAADDPQAETRSPAEVLGERLSVLARKRFHASSGIARLTRLTAGATQEIWRFDLTHDGGSDTPLILRRTPAGRAAAAAAAAANATGAAAQATGSSISLDVEAAVIRLAYDAHVPAPAVKYVLSPEDNMGVGFIMEFVEGETLGGRIVRDERFAATRPKLARQCGEILARIHSIAPGEAPQLRHQTPAELVAHWRGSYDNTNWPRPVFDLAFRWLAERLPPPGEPTLVHGDFRNGNLMFRPAEGVVAVLDWELAHVGDPMEDLGWICVNPWRFGMSDKPVGGFGEREDLYAGYEAISGEPVNRAHVQFWEVFGALRWGVMCAGMTAAFRVGDPSVERSVIARRASETEVDLMRMLAS